MIGGKIAPRPSLLSRWSTIHCVAFSRARFRNGLRGIFSIDFRTASRALKNARQTSSRPLTRRFAPPSPEREGQNNSSIEQCTSQVGLNAQIIESGTMMQRDQYDIL